MPIRDMRVYLRVPAPRGSHTLPLPRCVHRASCERTTHRVHAGACVVSTGPRIGVRCVRTFLCVPARGFAIILSITPGIGIIPQQRLAERWECTLIDKTVYRDTMLGTPLRGGSCNWDNISCWKTHTLLICPLWSRSSCFNTC